MQQVAPAGSVYQAGTLSGNPLAMAAGLATLEAAFREDAWARAERWAAAAQALLLGAAREAGVALTVQRQGTMFTPFFTDRPVTDFATAKMADGQAYARFFHAMLAKGVYLPPSAFEAAFTSSAHGMAELEHFAEALPGAIRAAAEAR
jgi:glutamate-1-semialdehyde 2,1-aminomutase